MSNVKISANASGTGTVTIAAPNTNTDRTLTLPDASGTLNTSGAVNEVPAGSASAPAIYPTGDSNTGIFFPAADTAAIATGGSERMRVNSSGNVGIGVTPSAWGTLRGFDIDGGAGIGSAFNTWYSTANAYFSGSAWVYKATAPAMQYEAGANGHIWYTAPSGTAGNSITFTERARIDSSGNFMVGTTSTYSSSKMTVESTANIGITSKQGTAGGYCFLAYALNNGGTYYHASFQEAGTQRGSITSNGSATAYNTTSDYRLKENIAPITNALSKVVALKPCTYTWKNNGFFGEGFIAHELAEVCPQAVTGEKDAVDAEGNPKYQGVDTSFLVATLTAAIQELNAKVEAQAAEIAALKGQA